MNVKNFLTLAMVLNLVYGVWYFIHPTGAHAFYGVGPEASAVSLVLVEYLGAACIATGVMCGVARNAGRSPARTAVLAFVAVASLLWLYLDIRTLGPSPGAMHWFDIAINGLLGLGALYFIMQDRKSTAAVAGIA